MSDIETVFRLIKDIFQETDSAKKTVIAISLLSLEVRSTVNLNQVLSLIESYPCHPNEPIVLRCMLSFLNSLIEKKQCNLEKIPFLTKKVLSVKVFSFSPEEELLVGEALKMLSLCEVNEYFLEFVTQKSDNFLNLLTYTLSSSKSSTKEYLENYFFEFLNVFSEEFKPKALELFTKIVSKFSIFVNENENEYKTTFAYLQICINLINNEILFHIPSPDLLFTFIEKNLALHKTWFCSDNSNFLGTNKMQIDSESDSFTSEEETEENSTLKITSSKHEVFINTKNISKLLDCLVICAKLFESTAFSNYKELLGALHISRIVYFLVEVAHQDEHVISIFMNSSLRKELFDYHCEVTYRCLCALLNCFSSQKPSVDMWAYLNKFSLQLLLQILMFRSLPHTYTLDYRSPCKASAAKFLLFLQESNNSSSLCFTEWIQVSNALQFELQSPSKCPQLISFLCGILSEAFPKPTLEVKKELTSVLVPLHKALLDVIIRKNSLDILCAALELIFTLFGDIHYNAIFEKLKTLQILIKLEQTLLQEINKAEVDKDKSLFYVEVAQNLQNFIEYKKFETKL